MDRLAGEGGLHPYAVADGVSTVLDDLVFQATAADVRHRPVSADEFLRLLDEAEADAATIEPADATGADPLTVQPGQPLDGTWTVTRVLGTGATARALLVRPTGEATDGHADSPRVFKVALDHEKDARLYAEAAALKEVGGGQIVKLLADPREIGGRTVLEIEYAGVSARPSTGTRSASVRVCAVRDDWATTSWSVSATTSSRPWTLWRPGACATATSNRTTSGCSGAVTVRGS